MATYPASSLDEVLAAVRKKMELEKQMMADIATGTLDVAWIDAALRRVGCDPEPRRCRQARCGLV